MKNAKTLMMTLLLCLLLSQPTVRAGSLKQKLLGACKIATELGQMLGIATWLVNEIAFEQLDAMIERDKAKEAAKILKQNEAKEHELPPPPPAPPEPVQEEGPEAVEITDPEDC